MMEIDQSSFTDWKKHPVTQVLMSILENYDNNSKEMMLNPEIVLQTGAQTHLAKIIGNREILGFILNLEWNDLKQQLEVNDVDRVDEG